MNPRLPDVVVNLVGEDGNAFAILGRAQRAMKRAGHGDLWEQYHEEATSGDYNNLIATTVRWFTIGEEDYR